MKSVTEELTEAPQSLWELNELLLQRTYGDLLQQLILMLWCLAPWAGRTVFLIMCHKLNVIVSVFPVPWLHTLISLNISFSLQSFIYRWLECVTKWELILFTSQSYHCRCHIHPEFTFALRQTMASPGAFFMHLTRIYLL